MASSLRELSRSTRSLPLSELCRQVYRAPLCARRSASSSSAAAAAAPAAELDDIETESNLHLPSPTADSKEKEQFRPWARQKRRSRQLPAGRFQYHPPKYYRGPLHPVQSLPSSDPTSREFVPGPFNMPRLKETYLTTVASDLMTLAYQHVPPGTEKPEREERLRGWDGSSPYHKNRPRKGPRGGSGELPLIEQPITHNNVPALTEITVHTYQPMGLRDKDYLVAARTALLALSGTMPEVTKTKSNIAGWQIQPGKVAGFKVTMYGNEAYEFLDKCTHLVFPRIKDWLGIEGTTGDGSGNIAWGFTPAQLSLFPEIAVNLDMYPAKMLPGCHVYIKTTASSTRQARLLLQALGVPFIGELQT